MSELWTPGHVASDEAKDDGGSHFDDELETSAHMRARVQKDYNRMAAHLNERPDHTVYVGSADDRTKMRSVFNHMKSQGIIGHNPNIRIEYGVPEGAIRIVE